MRLDKYIANNSAWSRSDVKRLIKQQAIYINEALATSSDQKINPFSDFVVVDKEHIQSQGSHYYMLHKPLNVVCANTHADYPTVLDLLLDIPAHIKSKLQIAGRLDVDTTGLVLITDDGQWNHSVTSPRSDCVKIYEVELEQAFDENTRSHFEKGMILSGEDKATLPASVEVIDARTVRLGICEGRYHQVKRMFLHTHNKVLKLHRASVGKLKLDSTLKPGEYRALTQDEVLAMGRAELKAHTQHA